MQIKYFVYEIMSDTVHDSFISLFSEKSMTTEKMAINFSAKFKFVSKLIWFQSADP